VHIKFYGGGKGSAKDAAEYLIAEHGRNQEKRASVEVVRGDPKLVAEISDSLSFVHGYTAGVIAFSPEDLPSDSEIDEVLDEFENTAWAGLEKDRYAWAAVLHRDRGGGCHVHIFAARVDLYTGKSLNIAPPGWQKIFDPLRDYFNYKYGWARPDDPGRARLVQPGHEAYIQASQLKAGLHVEESPRELITSYLIQRVETGVIENRNDVVESLRDTGLKVVRQGENYLTVKDSGSGKKWRLKGVLYEADFQRERLVRTFATKDGVGSASSRRPDEKATDKAFKRLVVQREKRIRYHKQRYQQPIGTAEFLFERAGGSSSIGSEEITKIRESQLACHDDNGGEPLHRFLRRTLGADAIFGQQGLESARNYELESIRNRGAGAGAFEVERESMGVEAASKRKREIRGFAERDGNRYKLESRQSQSNTARGEIKSGRNDRARAAIVRRIAESFRAIRTGTKVAKRASKGINATGKQLVRASECFTVANKIFGLATAEIGRRIRDRRDQKRRLAEMRSPVDKSPIDDSAVKFKKNKSHLPVNKP